MAAVVGTCFGRVAPGLPPSFQCEWVRLQAVAAAGAVEAAAGAVEAAAGAAAGAGSTETLLQGGIAASSSACCRVGCTSWNAEKSVDSAIAARADIPARRL